VEVVLLGAQAGEEAVADEPVLSSVYTGFKRQIQGVRRREKKRGGESCSRKRHGFEDTLQG
jgi:hypothetical protein